MVGRTASKVAGGLWLVALALAIAGGLLQYVTRHVPVEYYGLRGFQGILGVLIASAGWLIVSRHRDNPIGWIFVFAGVVSGMQAFESAYVTLSISEHGGSLPLTQIFVWLSVWIWVLIVGLLGTYVVLLFPEGRLQGRGQRAVAVYAGVALALFAASVSVTPGQAGEVPVGVHNPYAIEGTLNSLFGAVGGTAFIVAVVLSVAVLIQRFRRSAGVLRQQMKWLTYAAALAALALSISTAFLAAGATAENLAVRLTAVGVVVGFGGIPVAAGVAILRYGLYEIDVVINKTIVYAVLAAFISVVYVGVVLGIGALIGSGANTGLTIAATAIVAVAAQPVRVRANHIADRLVFGKRSSPYEALSQFTARVAAAYGAEEALPQLAELVTAATAADRAAVWLVVGDMLRPVGTSPVHPLEPLPLVGAEPDVPGADHVFPVRHEGELLGAVSVNTPPNDPLSPPQERLLRDLTSQAGILLRTVRLIEELRASRQRLVAAQDLERRRIERNLHDGAQQHLVALAVNLRVARAALDSDPATATGLLEQLQADAGEALENLRDLARGIYPPLLADKGLVPALEAQSSKASIPVEVHGDGVGRYPQEVEAAVYFCVLEALQNIAKYARAARARVDLATEDGRLRFTVTDDGTGFDVRTAKKGSGLTNMADRLNALGGALEVSSRPGHGTEIKGSVEASPVPVQP